MDPRDLPTVSQRTTYASLDSLRKWWGSLGQDSSLGAEEGSFDFEAGHGRLPPRPTPARSATMPAVSHRKTASDPAEINRADAMRARPAPRPPRAHRTAVLQTSAADKFLGTAATAAGRHREERLPRFIIHPLSPAYRAWWYLTVFVAALTAILVPYVIAFTLPGLYQYDSGTSIVEYMCIAFIAADMVVSFNVARYVNGELVADRRQLAKNYTRLIFWVDLLSIVPFDEVALAIAGLAGPNYVNDPVKAQYFSLLKILRLLRMYRLQWFFSYLTFNLAAPLLAVTLLRNLFYTFFLANFAACAFYFVALQQGLGPNTWVGATADWMGPTSTSDMYIWSLYWSLVTLSTTGYGDIRPYNPVEAGMVSIYVLFVFFYAAYIIGSITLIVVKGDDRVGRYRDQMRALQSYAALHSLPGDLRESMMRHLKLHFYNAEAADETVLKVYPSSIRRRVLRQLYLRTIRECYLFAGAKPRFLDALLAVSRVELYLPMVEVISQGDYVNELFILAAGRVACVTVPGGHGEGGSAGNTVDEENPMGLSGYFRVGSGGYSLNRPSYVTSTIAEDGSVRGGSVRGGSARKSSARGEGSAHGGMAIFDVDETAKVMEEGDVFGEVAFFTGTAQTETVVTMSACRVLAIARTAFEQVAATFPTSQKIVLMHLARHGEDNALELFPGPVGLGVFQKAMAAESRAAPVGNGATTSEDRGVGGTAAFTGGDPTWRLAPGRAAALRLTPAQERAVGSLLQVKGVVSRAVAKHDADRTTEWLYAATRGDLVKVNEMIGHGFDPDAADYDHRTALMLAAGRGHREVVDALLAAGAALNAKDAFEGTALLEACRGGHDEVIDVLRRAGAGLAVSHVHEAAFLCAAVQEGDLKLLRRLLRAGAAVDAADYDGRTALHLAASKGNVPAVEVLVAEGGADLSKRDNWGATAAEEARRVGARACETFLVAEQEALRAKERVKSSAEFAPIAEEEEEGREGEEGGGSGDQGRDDTTED